MSAEHTPGPLRINGLTIMLGRRNIGRAFVTPETNSARALANVRLWALAPELLEALKAQDEYMIATGYSGPEDSALHPRAAENWRRIRASISKAEGHDA